MHDERKTGVLQMSEICHSQYRVVEAGGVRQVVIDHADVPRGAARLAPTRSVLHRSDTQHRTSRFVMPGNSMTRRSVRPERCIQLVRPGGAANCYTGIALVGGQKAHCACANSLGCRPISAMIL